MPLHPFLILVLAGFGVFGAVLLGVSLWSERPPATSRAPRADLKGRATPSPSGQRRAA